jgi:hypothetical protein
VIERLFSLTFLCAAPFWALMIFAPHWRTTGRIMASPYVVVPPALIYAALVAMHFPAVWAAVSSPEPGPLSDFLGTPEGATIAWAHFIAWDLFIGRWIYRQSRELDVHPLVMAPILLLTILMSPVGLLAFLPIRAVRARRVIHPLTV